MRIQVLVLFFLIGASEGVFAADGMSEGWVDVGQQPRLQVHDKLREVLSGEDADDIYQELEKNGIKNLDVVGPLINIIDQYKAKKTGLKKLKFDLINECIRLGQEKAKLPPGWALVDEPQEDMPLEKAPKSGFWSHFGW